MRAQCVNHLPRWRTRTSGAGSAVSPTSRPTAPRPRLAGRSRPLLQAENLNRGGARFCRSVSELPKLVARNRRPSALSTHVNPKPAVRRTMFSRPTTCNCVSDLPTLSPCPSKSSGRCRCLAPSPGLATPRVIERLLLGAGGLGAVEPGARATAAHTLSLARRRARSPKQRVRLP